MDHRRTDRFRAFLHINATRRATIGTALVTMFLARLTGTDDAAASKKGKRRRRRRARARERAQEKVCQQVCGGSCQSCRAACADCPDHRVCYHQPDGPPICESGVITTCEPCSSDADCPGAQFCVTGTTYKGKTERDLQCGAYSVGVCMEELP